MRKFVRAAIDVPHARLYKRAVLRRQTSITFLSLPSFSLSTKLRHYSSSGVPRAEDRKMTPIEKANANRRAERFMSEQEIEKAKQENEEDNIWDDKAQEKGMDLVFRRATNILQAVTERQMTKLLQIHCGGENVNFFEADGVKKANWIVATGISDDMTNVAECSTLDIFADTILTKEPLDRHAVLPFKEREFNFTVCMLPSTVEDGSVMDIKELSRITNHGGFIIIGARAKIWEGDNVMSHLENNKSAQLLSVQSIEYMLLNQPESYFLALLRK